MNLLYQMFPLALGIATPIIICALGGLFSERSGIVNIALEGIMLVGAFFGATASLFLEGSLGDLAPWAGALVGMIAGCLYSLIHAFASVSLKADQTISGAALNMLSTGLTVYLCQIIFGAQRSEQFLERFRRISIPVLKDIPVIGDLLFTNVFPTFYLAVGLAVLTWFVVFKSKFGLHLRSCGEYPQASASMGIHVEKMRYIGVLISGCLGGLAGAIMVLSLDVQFTVFSIHGIGFISMACLIFGKWNPYGCLGAGIFFGFSQVLSNYSGQIPFLNGLPSELFFALPYLLTIAALLLFSRKSVGPKASGEIYDSGKR
ncbi:ABC transporter permease [Massilicoli timonensis]|uniref:ABC transporter permease n=1 Tax=Massilicoli timonensis TaxID=2015901 RepID=A0ABT1SIM0_9FIRM|nr:ABC transporter permease [Massilicoli timonensis]MCQ5121051.1 ABC transporter permease [Massilicoli timonensis]